MAFSLSCVVPFTALQAADVVVVVAGCDAALPGVIAGLVEAPVVAIPTSTGPAAALQGLGSLVSCVSSCVPGVTVVNIDGGVQAAVIAARILRTVAARMRRFTDASVHSAAPAPALPVAHGNGNGVHGNGNGNGQVASGNGATSYGNGAGYHSNGTQYAGAFSAAVNNAVAFEAQAPNTPILIS